MLIRNLPRFLSIKEDAPNRWIQFSSGDHRNDI